MDLTRKLASIRQIAEILPIDGADKLELAKVDGWQCVVTKGKHQSGERIVFFEIDSFLPIEPAYEFLRKGCYKNVEGLGEGFRIKTIKLRGQLSQGLVMALADVGLQDYVASLGEDVTEQLRVKKYEKPTPAQLRGQMAGSFPAFIPKTDQERIQNCHARIARNVDYELTLKLDGTSVTAYHHDGHIGICSRNYELKDDGNAYWEAAKSNGWIVALEDCRDNGVNLALQGELLGPGVQGNRENLAEPMLFLFDIYDIDLGAYYAPEDRRNCSLIFNLQHVPVIAAYRKPGEMSVDQILALSDIPSLTHPVAEGVVWKRFDGQDSFKAINNKFLLAEA